MLCAKDFFLWCKNSSKLPSRFPITTKMTQARWWQNQHNANQKNKKQNKPTHKTKTGWHEYEACCRGHSNFYSHLSLLSSVETFVSQNDMIHLSHVGVSTVSGCIYQLRHDGSYQTRHDGSHQTRHDGRHQTQSRMSYQTQGMMRLTRHKAWWESPDTRHDASHQTQGMMGDTRHNMMGDTRHKAWW